jgi:hypothetical protein
MSDVVPDIRQRIIWVKNAQRAVGFIGETRIEWLAEVNAVLVGTSTQQISAFQNIGQVLQIGQHRQRSFRNRYVDQRLVDLWSSLRIAALLTF